MSNRPKTLTDILNHLEKGEKAIEILRDLWLSMDSAYSSTINLTGKQKKDIQDFFDFDDSE